MAIEIRPALAAEMDQVGMMASYSYGGAFGDEPDNITASSNQPEWTLCAFDGAKMVTSFSAFPFTMRANGKAMAFAGITAVGTRPEYRRRGLVRKIMTQALSDERDRGQTVAGLWASQAAIYQRYGFARAGVLRRYCVDTVDIRFTDDLPVQAEVERLNPPEAMDDLKSVYREFISDRMGYIHRAQVMWRTGALEEIEDQGPVYCGVAYSDGVPRGYVIYTIRAAKVDNPARSQRLVIRDLAWLDIDAYRSVWNFIARHDLVGEVVWECAPLDDPAVELFMEPRLLNTQDGEGSWWRIVDVPNALSQRGYLGEGRINIGIAGDSLADWNNGVWQLEVGSGEAVANTTKQSADVEISVKALSSLFSGMCSARELASWGMVSGDTMSLAVLDGLFASRHAPHCPDHY